MKDWFSVVRKVAEGQRVEVLVYKDFHSYTESGKHHKALCDFTPLMEAMEDEDLAKPGQVFDCFIYDEDGLLGNKVLEWPPPK